MSLKYLTIKEVIYNMSSQELNRLKNDIHNIVHTREHNAIKNFNNTVSKLTNTDPIDRSWTIPLPRADKKYLTLNWICSYNSVYNNTEYKYRLYANFDQDKVTIVKYVICSCNDAYCSNCHRYQNEINTSTVFAISDLNNISLPFDITKFIPIFTNYHKLYNEYFNCFQ